MSARAIRVAAIAATPVKGLRIAARSRAVIERGGLRGDRRFYLIDERGRTINGKHCGELNQVTADLDDCRLRFVFPDGSEVVGVPEPAELVQSTFYSRPRPARLIRGPFSAALSAHCGRALRLVRSADGTSAIDRGAEGAVSIVSRASVAHLARFAGETALDARRFRMSIELTGAKMLEEDGWVGAEIALGTARIAVGGHVGRCIVTSRHPETGEIDLPTLEHLRRMRVGATTTEPLGLGVFGSVSRPGTVGVGDVVEVL